ncbi:DNA ligase D-like 3'-phosphoesterase domain-containing protein [Saccharomonospora marina XMU15]|uniref:DNA ligase D-like 3'-phosphoesterase domain-containing protein n=2 Tax=Saccharomonospora TaxID=1851 RepID=H5X2A7_9PSEU|nr:DNA ligase D-like 3'-phosphoesterase domain-containing protein [Saccharomonospora marina XMU15]
MILAPGGTKCRAPRVTERPGRDWRPPPSVREWIPLQTVPCAYAFTCRYVGYLWPMADQEAPPDADVKAGASSSKQHEAAKRKRPDRSRFVIQKHDATSLHYDFRLEIGGVLVSWSIPKGPSLDPGDKRLAIRTEDHSPEYADFEGRIPEGEYGAGSVLVWDSGTFTNLSATSIEQGLTDGRMSIWLEGHKLHGAFAMVRTRPSTTQEQWLLIKKDDEGAYHEHHPGATLPESVLSGRTSEELS